MKTVILAGGFGTRIREESIDKPKPMVEIGDTPILQHIMKIYSYWGYNDFIICLGYKGYTIKEYFLHYYEHLHSIYIDLETGGVSINGKKDPWKVDLVDTGELTQTGGRLKRIEHIIKYNDSFMMTYGDGLSDVNINDIIKFHNKKGKLVTFLAVNNPSKFGNASINYNGIVNYYGEKTTTKSYINGGFFVVNIEALNYIKNDQTSWETDCLPKLVKEKQLTAYKYDGFWKCMDSIKDKEELCKMWNSGKAPWKIW